MISLHGLAFKSLRFYWRTQVPVLAGAVTAAAVLVGAMLVGDSVRYSLLQFALSSLGGTHYAMDTHHRFVSDELAAGLDSELDAPVAPVLRLKGIAVKQDKSGIVAAQVNRVQVLGVDAGFWELSSGGDPELGDGEAALSVKLALALGVSEGDEVGISVGQPSLMPRDAPLASRKERLSRRGLFTVKRIVPDEAMGRFSLRANQVAPYNAFVNLDWAQQRVGLEDRINLILVGSAGGERALSRQDLEQALERQWKLAHVGLAFRRSPDRQVMQLESDRVFLDPEVARAALPADAPGGGTNAAAAAPVGVLTYLVNEIRKPDGEAGQRTPYSFVTACSPTGDGRLGPVPADMADDRVILNSWTARQLGARVGDPVRLTYWELAAGGRFLERSRTFTVHSIMGMRELQAERALTPEFPGLTDVNSCREWDIGMPMDEEELQDRANEQYWQKYKTTPKALVTLKAGREMWGNRFGNLSAVRFRASPAKEDAIREALAARIDPTRMGLFFLPLREQTLQAVQQAEDLGSYFLGMSFFLIVAGLMLTGLLFVFGVQQRSREMGVLLAVGLRVRQVRRLFLMEGAVVALAGSVAGAVVGIAYTRALIWGLGTFWQGAVAGSAIRFHMSLRTLATGALASFLCAVVAVALAMWRQARRPARELLAADLTQEQGVRVGRRRSWVALSLSVGGVAAAVGIMLYAWLGDLHNLVPAFFGAGSLLLLAGLGFGSLFLRAMETGALGRLTLTALGARNASRRRGRSLTSMGLLACGSFMVFAVSSMQEDIEGHAGARTSGTGGFELFAEATLPVPDPLGSTQGQKRFNLDRESLAKRAGFVSMKAHDGDDASCFNLNQAQAPRLIGVDPDAFSSRGAFAEDAEALWALLETDLPEGVVPGLAGDSDTAMYGLKRPVGPDKGGLLAYRDERGNQFKVKLVGKLPMRLSVFQGTVLVPIGALEQRYPSEDGYRVFLLDAPEGAAEELRQILNRRLDKVGLDVTTTVERLEEFYAVESTYLGMFLILGGLGLVLGSVGMGIVVLRNVMERRPELAVLRCIGFTQGQVARVVVAEHWLLLLAGLGVGVVSSAIAIWPNLSAPGVKVPFATVAVLLGGVLLVGLLWTAAAARLALRGTLIASLRNE